MPVTTSPLPHLFPHFQSASALKPSLPGPGRSLDHPLAQSWLPEMFQGFLLPARTFHPLLLHSLPFLHRSKTSWTWVRVRRRCIRLISVFSCILSCSVSLPNICIGNTLKTIKADMELPRGSRDVNEWPGVDFPGKGGRGGPTYLRNQAQAEKGNISNSAVRIDATLRPHWRVLASFVASY